ncbi:MAG: nitrogen fixation protein NifZ [Methylococcales bacterium]|nr:nitrogen fixation protein NifZ [Methylococcales bacterium]
MRIEELNIGDVVYAAKTILDDGSIPDGSEGEVFVTAGTRGVITMIGHVEEQPETSVFLVRFEDAALNLSAPIGCWVEDLAVEPR